jgi:phospholipid transport system substrate-binding protein
VISNYSAALADYDDDRVEVYPLRKNAQSGRILTVQSVIIRKSGQRIPISYLVSNSTGNWRINDFTIENVSMIQSYKSQFAAPLSEGGLAKLIQQLGSHNQKSRR